MTGNSNSGDQMWADFRRQMPIARKWAYLDHAAVAPLSGPAQQALVRWSEQAACDGESAWAAWNGQVHQTRLRAASIIGAEADLVALVPNTTAGIGLVAEGFPWQEGDNVVTLGNEFPSNLYPWLNLANRGVQTRRVPVDGVALDLQRLADTCDDRTRIVSVSWVGYATGWRVDVDELTQLVHDRGALLFLDAIQGLGVFPLDVSHIPVDFVAADGHKWMLGPEGAGLFYLRREHLDLLRPLGVGWNSVVHAHDYGRIELNLRPTAARYEGGSQNMAGFIALGESLRLLQQNGLSPAESPVAQRVAEITQLACDELARIGARIISDRSAEHGSGIVAFELAGYDPAMVRKRCLEAGVAISCRGGWLRISPHAYVDEGDVDRLISALRTR